MSAVGKRIFCGTFRAFEEAAVRGDPCPSYEDIRRQLHCALGSIDMAVARLLQEKWIELQREGNARRAVIRKGPMAGRITGWRLPKQVAVFVPKVRPGACNACKGDIVQREGESVSKFNGRATCSEACRKARKSVAGTMAGAASKKQAENLAGFPTANGTIELPANAFANEANADDGGRFTGIRMADRRTYGGVASYGR